MSSRSIAATVMVMTGLATGCFGAEPAALHAGESPAVGEPTPAEKADPTDMITASRITLNVKDAKLADVLAEIAKQSGNKALEVGQDIVPKPVAVSFDKTPYWEALDVLCKQQGLTYRAVPVEPNAPIDPKSARMELVAAPAGDAKTCTVGPVVFRMVPASAPDEADGPAAAGKLKCTVEFFWEDRLAASAFTAVAIEKITDGGGKPCELPRALTMSVGKMTTAGAIGNSGQLEIRDGAFWGSSNFLINKPPDKAAALAEMSGSLTLFKPFGKVELRIENALAGEGQSVERDGYKLTITKVGLDEASATLTLITEFTKDGNQVALPWPARGGWSLVDAQGKTIDGMLMGGRNVIFRLVPPGGGPYTLVRVYRPNDIQATYKFRFTDVPIP